MGISIEMIKQLREETGAGVLDAKKALEAANGDFDMAATELKKKGAAKAEKRSDRKAKEGMVELYAHPGNRVGVMVEVNCETDFVARNEAFRTLAHDLALHIAAMEPKYVSPETVPADELEKMTASLREDASSQGKPEEIVEKIVSGRLRKFYEDTCLTEQAFVKDDEVKVKDLVMDVIRKTGENVIIRRFVRYGLGEES